MKIVHCIFSFNTGGAETMLVDILNEQVKTHSVYLIIVNDSVTESLLGCIDDRVRVILVKRKNNIFTNLYFLKFNFVLSIIKPDVVHVHNAALTRAIFRPLSRALFLTVHDLNIPLEYLSRDVIVIAISDSVAHDIRNRCNCQVYTIPNGIALHSIYRRALKGYDKNRTFRVVQVARLDFEKKGQDILIKALAILKNRGIVNIVVDFIGEGSDFDKLQDLTGGKRSSYTELLLAVTGFIVSAIHFGRIDLFFFFDKFCV